MADALISIKPKYVDRFLNGQKAVEIRTRRVNLQNNARLWIYSTLPKASIQTVAYVKYVESDTPDVIWSKYSQSIGISKRRFNEYVNGSIQISAIVTESIWKLPFEMSLQKIRKEVPEFHPPQFLKFLAKDDPLFIAIMNILAKELNMSTMSEPDIGALTN